MKKRIFAMLVVIALVFSAFAVLTACGEEYTVKFKYNNGKTLFELTTSGGKLAKKDVEDMEKQYARQLSSREPEGYFFSGWFSKVSKDEDGNTVYSNPINYAKTYTEDTAYEAGYEFLPISGEENGYTLVGVIGTIQDWGGDDGDNVTHTEWTFDQNQTEGWKYSLKGINLLPGNSFKVKTIGLAWDEGKVKIGYEGVNEVVLGDGVEADLKGHELKGELILGADDNNGGLNIKVSQWVESATANFDFNYRTKKLDITLTAITVRTELPKTEWILVGNFTEDKWASSTTKDTLIFEDNGDNTYTVSHAFTMGLEWRIKTNVADWDDTQYGYNHLGTPTKGAGVDEIPADLFKAGSQDNNIGTNYDCTLKITLNVESETIEIEVTQITIPDEEVKLTYVITGSFSSNKWNETSAVEGYIFSETDQPNQYQLTIDMPQNLEWQIIGLPGGYGVFRLGRGSVRNITKEATITDDVSGTNLFGGNISVTSNVEVKRTCNVTITIDVVAMKIDLHVNTIQAATQNDERWVIAGSMNGWPESTAPASQYIMEESGDIATLTITLTSGTTFKFKQAYSWAKQYHWNNTNKTYTSEDGISTDGLFSGNGENFKVNDRCTVTFTLNTSTGALTIHVTSRG